MNALHTPMSGGVRTPRPSSIRKPWRKKALVVIGPPCTGKTDFATGLCSSWGFVKHYSSSTALRAYATRNHRQDILEEMAAGELVSDFDVVKRVSGAHYRDFDLRLGDGEVGIFDGWGRTGPELEYCLEMLCLWDYEVHVVFLNAPDEVLWQRARNRKRDDDASIARRIELFRYYFSDLFDVAEARLGFGNCHVIETDKFDQATTLDIIKGRLRIVA